MPQTSATKPLQRPQVIFLSILTRSTSWLPAGSPGYRLPVCKCSNRRTDIVICDSYVSE